MAKIEALNIFMVPVLSVMAHTSVLKYSTTSKMMPMMARICFPFSYEQPPYVFMIRKGQVSSRKGLENGGHFVIINIHASRHVNS